MANGRKRNHNFIVQGGILAVAGVITRMIGLFYRVPVTNIIGDEGNGYYAAAYQIYNIMLLISSYSLPLAISKVVSARYSKDEYVNSKRVFYGGLIFAFISGSIACAALFFGADFFAGVLMHESGSAIALRIFAPTLLIVAIMGVLRGYFQGMGTMIPTAVSQIIEQLVNAAVSIIAASAFFAYGKKVAALLSNESYAPAYGAAGSTLGTSLGALSGLIVLLFILLIIDTAMKRDRLFVDDTHPDETLGAVIKLIIITAVPVILSTAIYNLSDVLDNGIFNYLMTIKDNPDKTRIWGIYSGKYRLMINVPIAFANALCSSTVPALTACMASGNLRAARVKIGNAMRFTMLIAFPATVGFIILSKPILSMLFTGDLTLASRLLSVGAVTILFTSASTLTNGVLQGINHLEAPVRHSAIALVIHLISLYLMTGKFDLGIYGVIFSTLIFSVLMCIMNQFSIRRYIHYRQEMTRTFLIPAISSLLMGAVVFAVYKLFSLLTGNLISTLLSILFGFLTYSLSILKLKGIKKEELLSLPGGSVLIRIGKSLRVL